MKVKPSKQPGEVILEMNRGDEQLMKAGDVAASAFRMKKLLVPVDFSECSTKALQYAIPLAKEHGASLTLLYVVQPIYVAGEFVGVDTGQTEAALCESGSKQLAKLCQEIVGNTVPTETLVRLGSPVTEVLEAAKSLNIDVIVISTHGRTGLKHILLGSVAERIVQRAPCPVLVVREREHEFISP